MPQAIAYAGSCGLGRAFFLVLLLAGVAPAAAGPRNVLILRGEAPDLAGVRVVLDEVQTTIRKNSPSPVEFYVETVDAGHDGDEYERRLSDLLAIRFGEIPVHLVVALTESSARFALHQRARLFADVPLLIGLVDPGFIAPGALPARSSVVFAPIDPAATLRLALQLYPAARRVLVAGGSSEFDRTWQRAVRQDFRAF